MKSMERDMQWGWRVVVMVSFLFAVCAVRAHAWQQNEVESDLLLKLATASSSSSSDIYNEGPLEVDSFTVYSTGLSGLHHHNSHQQHRHHLGLHKHEHETHDQNHHHSWRKHGPTFVEVKVASSEQEPPLPLFIASPKEAGDYPVIMFQHGFSMRNTFYSQLMEHVASHGFIVVAPQMYNYYSGSDVTSEICSAASVIDWMPAGLSKVIWKRVEASVKPDLSKLALVGHSRGGKVVFGLATGVCTKASLKLSAIAGLDPVDGMSASQQTVPPILQFSQHALKLDMPTLIVGSGLGPEKKWFFPACAPEGVSHRAFYYESDAPAFHFVAPEYGHMDFMDDFTAGVQGFLSYWTCKNGAEGRGPMRRFTGGILVAFFRAALQEDNSQLSAAISQSSQAPVKLEKPESYGSL